MDKILKIIFTLIILSLSIGEITRISFGNVGIILTDLLSLAFIVLFLIRKVQEKSKFNSVLLKPILFFLLTLAISLIINSSNLTHIQLLTSSLYIVRIVLYCLIYLTLMDMKNLRHLTPKLLLVSGVIFMIVGYLQYVLYPNLRNLQYLGWDVHLNRLFGSYLDPNFTGIMLVLFLSFFIFLVSKGIFLKNKLYILPIMALTILAIILTYSRTSYIALFIFGLFSMIYFNKKKFVLILLVPFIMVLIFLLKNGKTENTNILRVTSSLARVENYSHAIRIFQDHPVFGVGFNAYRYSQQTYGFIKRDFVFEDHAGSGSDNSFLLLLATSGVLGFIAYLNLLKTALARKYLSREDKYLFSSTVIILVVGSFFINALFYPFFLLWFFVMSAITENS